MEPKPPTKTHKTHQGKILIKGMGPGHNTPHPQIIRILSIHRTTRPDGSYLNVSIRENTQSYPIIDIGTYV